MLKALRVIGRVMVLLALLFLFNFTLLEASTLRLDQTKIRLSIAPGQGKSGKITVDNPTDQVLNIKVYAEDWAYTPKQDGTKDFMMAGTGAFSGAQWLTFVPADFTLPPYGRQTLNYTVKVPADASGGHYAVLFFENAGAAPQESTGMNLIVRIGVIFYFEAQGTTRRACEISGLKAEKGNKEALVVSLNFKNTGNVDITGRTTFDLIDSNGLVYARGAFNDLYTFPQDAAVIKASWQEAIPPGTYDLVITLDMTKQPGAASEIKSQVLTREAQITIGKDGQIVKVGELR
jgi:hypothetical protein